METGYTREKLTGDFYVILPRSLGIWWNMYLQTQLWGFSAWAEYSHLGQSDLVTFSEQWNEWKRQPLTFDKWISFRSHQHHPANTNGPWSSHYFAGKSGVQAPAAKHHSKIWNQKNPLVIPHGHRKNMAHLHDFPSRCLHLCILDLKFLCLIAADCMTKRGPNVKMIGVRGDWGNLRQTMSKVQPEVWWCLSSSTQCVLIT